MYAIGVIICLSVELLMLTASPVPQTNGTFVEISTSGKSSIKKRETTESACPSSSKIVLGTELDSVFKAFEATNAFERRISADLEKIASFYRRSLPHKNDLKITFKVEKCNSENNKGREGQDVQCVQKYSKFIVKVAERKGLTFKIPTKCSLQLRV
jgi:hypothetical protein